MGQNVSLYNLLCLDQCPASMANLILLPNSKLVLDMLQTNREGEITVDNRCRTGMAGVFACGDVTDVPFKQVIVAAGEGAKAALAAYDYLINQK